MTNDSALSDGIVGTDQIQELLHALNEENPYKLGHIVENLYSKYKIFVTVLDQEVKEQCSTSYDNKNVASGSSGYGGAGPNKNYGR